MRKLLLALTLLLIPAAASAQCSGAFGANTACGTVAGGVPGPIPFSSIGGSGSPGGSNTQVQYNAAGVFGGISGATSDGVKITLVAPILGAATGTSLTLNGAAVTGTGGISAALNANGNLQWKLVNTSNGTSASTLVTLGNDISTGDLEIWSSTNAFTLAANRMGFIAGNGLLGSIFTTVNGGTHDFAISNTKIASVTSTGITTLGGTQANPGINVGATAGYGMYSPGANQLGFVQNATLIVDYNITNASKFTFGANAIASGSFLSTFATGGMGYTTGAGGAITQGSSRTTGVTLNTVTGAITLVSAAGSATPASFTVTDSAVAATDVITVNQRSGTDLYEIFVTAVAAGSFRITSFTTGGTTTEQPVFNFAIVKGSAN